MEWKGRRQSKHVDDRRGQRKVDASVFADHETGAKTFISGRFTNKYALHATDMYNRYKATGVDEKKARSYAGRVASDWARAEAEDAKRARPKPKPRGGKHGG